MSNRPTVGIIGADGASSGQTHTLPAVFSSPIRPDIVQYESLNDDDLESWLRRGQDGSYRHGQEQETAVRCEREGW